MGLADTRAGSCNSLVVISIKWKDATTSVLYPVLLIQDLSHHLVVYIFSSHHQVLRPFGLFEFLRLLLFLVWWIQWRSTWHTSRRGLTNHQSGQGWPAIHHLREQPCYSRGSRFLLVQVDTVILSVFRSFWDSTPREGWSPHCCPSPDAPIILNQIRPFLHLTFK